METHTTNFFANHETDHQYFQSLQIKCPYRIKVFFVEFTFEETTYMKDHIKRKSDESWTEVAPAGQFADCTLHWPSIGMIVKNNAVRLNCEQWDNTTTILPKEIELQTEIKGWNGQFRTCPWPYILSRVTKYI